MINENTFREKIWGLPASELLGVGRATKKVLDNYYIKTIGQLANANPDFLRQKLGKNGVTLWDYANGRDFSKVSNKDFIPPAKSVGHGITTVCDLNTAQQVWRVMLELTQDIGHKLKAYHQYAQGVAIHIKDNNLMVKQWQTKLPLATNSPLVIAGNAFELFCDKYTWDKPVRSVTVQAIDLISDDIPRQANLFTDTECIDRLERLDNCIEMIRARFGKGSIKNGVLCQELFMPPEKAEIMMPTGMVN